VVLKHPKTCGASENTRFPGLQYTGDPKPKSVLVSGAGCCGVKVFVHVEPIEAYPISPPFVSCLAAISGAGVIIGWDTAGEVMYKIFKILSFTEF
jgi:hypothetical protein